MRETLIGRSGILRLLQRNQDGLRDIEAAIEFIGEDTPPRHVISASVNALAAGSGRKREYKKALAIVDTLRDKSKGISIHAHARGIIRWVRGLAYEQLQDQKNAIRCIESAISTFERLKMRHENKVALADLSRIRRKGKQQETNDRHILRLIEESIRLEVDQDTTEILRQVKEDPSIENIYIWRASLDSYMPNLEPKAEDVAVV